MSRKARSAGRILGLASVFALVVGPAHASPLKPPRGGSGFGHLAPARAGNLAVGLSRHKVRALGSWRSYVVDDPSTYIYPKSVSVIPNPPPLGTAGTVTNPGALEAADGNATTIHATVKGSPVLILDLGTVVGGRVQIGITQTDGTPVRLAYSEAERFLRPQGDLTYPAQGRNGEPNARADVVQGPPGAYTIPGVRGSERYVWLQLEGPGTVSIDYVRIDPNFLRPKPADYVGHFLSSDDLLNRIWYAGAYTLNLDTVRDPARGNQFAIADGAKRDRLVWLGDLDMEGLVASYTVRQLPPIFGRSIQMFTCQQYRDGYIVMASDTNVNCPRPGPPRGPHGAALGGCSCKFMPRLPEYTAWFIIAAADHYEMSGDPRVGEWLPVMRRVVAYFQRNRAADGLFVTARGQINWHPPDDASGEDAHTNAVWVRALGALATLEREIGSPALARKYARLSARLAAALRARLYDPSAGAFLLNTSDPIRNHPQDANVEAVLAGVLGGARAGRALSFVHNRLWGPYGPATGEVNNDRMMGRYISPWISGWELVDRLRGYDTEAALDLIRRLWGHMVRTDPAVTMWEKLTVDGGVGPYQQGNADGSPIVETNTTTDASSSNTSLAHGWSTAPTMALSAYVLGLRPASPGWRSWLVEPQRGDLSFAQGQVGTALGVLASRWTVDRTRHSFKLTVIAPARSSGTVEVPLVGARRATIARDGQIVWANGHAKPGVGAHRAGAYVRFPEGPGTHTYASVGR